jgi:hypothetical protein
MKKSNLLLLALALLILAGCKDPYEAELRPTDKSLLVVEGFLNKGALTTFRLSRTVNLSDSQQLKPELQAVLIVEGRDNTATPFAEKGGGIYEADLLHLQVGQEYRLRIRTAGGKEYLSDYVTVKNTPAIDSVSWRQQDDGLQIYTSTHDPNNNTRYYRWDYEETWEIRSYYVALYKLATDSTVVKRDMTTEDVSQCWKSSASTSIMLGSSAHLASDVISEAPVLFIPRADEKLSHRYSVLVRQYALSKDAYEYLQLMKKNTEQLGSIFDPQPSDISGNIHSVSDPEEPVIGFVSASEVQEKRIFIHSFQLNAWGYYLFCESTEVKNHPDSIRTYLNSNYQPYDAKFSNTGPGITHWYASSAFCVDCTSRGGINKKPSFW